MFHDFCTFSINFYCMISSDRHFLYNTFYLRRGNQHNLFKLKFSLFYSRKFHFYTLLELFGTKIKYFFLYYDVFFVLFS